MCPTSMTRTTVYQSKPSQSRFGREFCQVNRNTPYTFYRVTSAGSAIGSTHSKIQPVLKDRGTNVYTSFVVVSYWKTFNLHQTFQTSFLNLNLNETECNLFQNPQVPNLLPFESRHFPFCTGAVSSHEDLRYSSKQPPFQ